MMLVTSQLLANQTNIHSQKLYLTKSLKLSLSLTLLELLKLKSQLKRSTTALSNKELFWKIYKKISIRKWTLYSFSNSYKRLPAKSGKEALAKIK